MLIILRFYRPEQPPPYVSYPPQSIAGTAYVVPNMQYNGQTPPPYHLFWKNRRLTTITPKLRSFLLISGVIYTIWSLIILTFEVTIAFKSNWVYYRSIWTSGFILGGGISMLAVSCRSKYHMITLIRVFIVALLFCLLGIILSTVNYSTSTKCSNSYSNRESCDSELVSILKLTSLLIMIIIAIHTVINLIVFRNARKKSSAVQNP